MSNMGRHSTIREIKKVKKAENPVVNALVGNVSGAGIYDFAVCGACFVVYLVLCSIKMNKTAAIVAFALLFIVAGLVLVLDVFRNIKNGKIFTGELVLLVGAVAAFASGSYKAAALLGVVYRAVSVFYAYYLSKYEEELSGITNSIPNKVRIEENGELREVAPRAVDIDDIIVVKVGETIPLDGIVINGTTSVSMAKLGGNSTEIPVPRNGIVCAGCINLGKTIKVQVTETYNNTFAAFITDIVKHAYMSPSALERTAAKFAKFFPIAVLGISVVVCAVKGLISGDWLSAVNAASVVAILGTSAGIGISVPFAFKCCVANLSHRGVVIKKNCYVQDLAETGTAVFSKTGVLTNGKYTVHDVIPMQGVSGTKLMKAAVGAYCFSNSSIASALRAEAENISVDPSFVTIIEEVPQKGIHAMIGSSDVIVGTAEYLKNNGIVFTVFDKTGMLILCISIDGKYCGQITLYDKLRSGAYEMVDTLHLHGVNDVVMLTSDDSRTAKQMASSLNFDMVKSELNEENKYEAVEYLLENKRANTALTYIGDYRVDADLIELADVGISIKTFGSEIGLETADVCILGDEISKVGAVINAAKNCRIISLINIGVCAAAKLIMLILAIVGVMNITTAIFADAVVFCFTLFNSARELEDFEKK